MLEERKKRKKERNTVNVSKRKKERKKERNTLNVRMI